MNNESTIVDITLSLFIIHCYSKYACVVFKGHIYFQFSPASVYKYSPESHQMFQKYIVRIIRTSQMEFLCKGIVQDYNGYLALRLETI